MPDRFVRPASGLEAGDHACLVYDTDDRRRDVVLAYLTRGVERGEKLLYVAGGNAYDDDIVAEIARVAAPGQLDAVPADAVYPDVFDAERMVAGFAAAAAAAVGAGYPALRAVGGVPTASLLSAGSRAVGAYERKCDAIFADRTLVSLCEYDCRAVPDDIAAAALHAHAGTVYAFGAADESVEVEVEDGDVRVTGWVDFRSVGRLADALIPLVDAGGGVTVDLAACDYVDVAGVRLLLDAAADLHRRGGSLTLLHLPPAVTAALPLLGWPDVGPLHIH